MNEIKRTKYNINEKTKVQTEVFHYNHILELI